MLAGLQPARCSSLERNRFTLDLHQTEALFYFFYYSLLNLLFKMLDTRACPVACAQKTEYFFYTHTPTPAARQDAGCSAPRSAHVPAVPGQHAPAYAHGAAHAHTPGSTGRHAHTHTRTQETRVTTGVRGAHVGYHGSPGAGGKGGGWEPPAPGDSRHSVARSTWPLPGCGTTPLHRRTRLSPQEQGTAPQPAQSAWPPS